MGKESPQDKGLIDGIESSTDVDTFLNPKPAINRLRKQTIIFLVLERRLRVGPLSKNSLRGSTVNWLVFDLSWFRTSIPREIRPTSAFVFRIPMHQSGPQPPGIGKLLGHFVGMIHSQKRRKAAQTVIEAYGTVLVQSQTNTKPTIFMKTIKQTLPTFSLGNTLIRRSGVVLLAAFCLLGMASCEDDDDPIVDTVSQQDRNFAISSSQFINAQLSFGQLALDRGEDDSVLEYATMIVEDNTASKNELEGIANSKEIEVSGDVSDEMQAKYDELAALEGGDFDKAFIQFQLDALEDSKSMFENQIDNGQNFTVKGYAEKTLNLIKAHRTEATLVKVEIGLEDL